MGKVVSSKNAKISIKVGNGAFVQIKGVTNIGGLEGGSTPMIDTTDLDSTQKGKMPGTPDGGSYTLSLNFDPTDAGQKALDTVKASRDAAIFEIAADGGTKWTHNGYVTTFSKTVGVDTVWTGSVTIEVDGDITKVYPGSVA